MEKYHCKKCGVDVEKHVPSARARQIARALGNEQSLIALCFCENCREYKLADEVVAVATLEFPKPRIFTTDEQRAHQQAVNAFIHKMNRDEDDIAKPRIMFGTLEPTRTHAERMTLARAIFTLKEKK